MLDFSELENELENTEVIDLTTQVPYGSYIVKLYDLKKKTDTVRPKEKFSAMFKIVDGEYENCILWDNYYLSTQGDKRTLTYQYKLLKEFFLTLNPRIKWTFKNIDELENALKHYVEYTKDTKFEANFRQDTKGYNRVYLKRLDTTDTEKDDL